MKIIQLLMTPNDSTWQGTLLGLADNGVVYKSSRDSQWSVFKEPLEKEPVPRIAKTSCKHGDSYPCNPSCENGCFQ